MVAIFAVIIFLFLLIIGVPIAFVIGIVALFGVSMLDTIPMITVIQKIFAGLNSFVLLAVPLFILAANLMNSGKITDRLVDFATALVGHIRGGLAHANVVVSMFFAGISGSSTADTAGVGKMLIPSMIKHGYSKETSVAVTAASSTIGGIIPPSIVMIVYGSLAGVSIGGLFLAGIIPGILIGLVMMLIIYILSLKNNYPKMERVQFLKILRLFLKTIPPLLTPVIILVGITAGIVTPTEAAVLACVYAFILGKFVYKTLTWKKLPEIFIDTLELSSLSLFALGTANALGELMSYYHVDQHISSFFSQGFDYPWLFLVCVLVLFLFIGTFMDSIPAMVLFVPVLVPSALALNVDLTVLGIVIVMTLAIGLVTPPYGLCLLIASSIANLSMFRAFIGVVPYLIGILAVILLTTFFPWVILWLPQLLNPQW